MSQRLAKTLAGYAGYRQRDGMWLFLLHRLTGLGTLLFLSTHIVTTSMVYFSPARYSQFITLFRTPLFMLGEIVLVFCVIFHGVNGLKIAIFDLFKLDLWKKEAWHYSRIVTLVVAIVLWLPAAAVMGYNLLRYGLKIVGGE